MAFLIGGANSAADTGYNIDNSLRFAKGDTAYLSNATAGTSTLNTKMTLSFWMKICANAYDDTVAICWAYVDTNNRFGITMYQDKIIVYHKSAGTALEKRSDSIRYRDISAWYHVVVAVDTTQATAANRIKLYVNGVAAEIDAGNDAAEDSTIAFTQNVTQSIGANWSGSAWEGHWDGHLSEFYCIDGLAYDADDFGETDGDSGIWKPKDAKDDLTFGNNGFYLEFKNSAVGTGASDTIGADTSGEDQHFTSVNVAVVDNCTDSPTNNFCTWNPLFKHSLNPAYTPSLFSEGNLKLTLQNDSATMGTIGVSKGKWYYEYKFAEDVSANANYPTTGYTTNSHTFSANNMVGRTTASDSNYDGSTVYRGQKGTTVIDAQVFLGIEEADDIIGWYLDLDNETIICHKNGSTAMASGYTSGIDWSSGLTTGTPQDGFFYPMTRNNGHGTVGDEANFGNPSFAISSGNADANGYGNFEFDPTIGGVNYYALCTKNLAEFG